LLVCRGRLPYDTAVPFVVERDPQRGWIIVRAKGPLRIDDVLQIIRTARATVANRMVPMLFDGREAQGPITDADLDLAVAAVQEAVKVGGMRGHLAMVATDDGLYEGLLQYEARCADIGLRVMRVFRQVADAEYWLEIMSAARDFR
jgi:hypothetical protein